MSKIRQCNEKFFENLNNENPSYWAGFILGDGYISNLGYLTLHISEQDLTHLQKFKTAINSDNKITMTNPMSNKIKNKEFGMCSLSIYKPKVSQDLAKYGITKDKSRECTISKLIPKEMLHHFMRGVFDADGCFYVNNARKTAQFTLTASTKEFCEEYQEILIEQCNLTKIKIQSNPVGTCYNVTYVGNLQVKRIMDYLYKDATVYLERKYQKFQQHYANFSEKDKINKKIKIIEKDLPEDLKCKLLNDYITTAIPVIELCQNYKINIKAFYNIKRKEEMKYRNCIKRKNPKYLNKPET